MLGRPSLITRIAVGKLAGLAIGAAGFAVLPMLTPEVGTMLRWGVMLWYLTLGGLIGVAGVMTWHPVLRLPLPWWLMSTSLGAWMNFVLVLFIHDQAAALATAAFGAESLFANPFWMVLDGGIVGLVIGWLCHIAGGEGPETVEDVTPPVT